jgi:diguanylate cyclase (GGDEF)-like protein/PAS domain S-box-containing protein
VNDRLFRDAFERSSVPMWLVRARDGVIVDANAAAARFYGGDRSALLTSKVWEIDRQGESAFFETVSHATREGGREWLGPLALRSGEIRQVAVSWTPVEDGGETFLHAILHDATANAGSDAALRESEARYRTLTERLNIGVFQSTIDGKFSLANPAVVRMAGYASRDELLQVPAQALYADAADRTQIVDRLRTSGSITDMEIRSRKREGTEYWISLSAVLQEDGLGGQPSILGSVVDVTDRKQAEMALRESEDRYRTLTEQLPDYVWQKDREGRYVSCNRHYANDLSRTPETIIGHRDEDFYPPDLAAKYRADDLQVLSSGLPLEVEERWTDGVQERWLHTTKVPLADGQGRAVGTIGIGRDITQRKEAEEALRASEERWRTIVQNEPECVKLLDREGRLLEMNPAGLSMIQATFEQVAGMPMAGLVAEEDRPAFDEMVAAVFRGETRHLIYDMIGLEGRRLTLETTSVPLWETTGAPPAVGSLLGVTRDVTERKRDEERLKRAAAVFSSSREGFVITNDKGEVEEINEAFTAITGYERPEAIGQNMRFLRSGRHDHAFYQEMWQELVRTGQWQGEIWNRRKDGTIFPEWLSISVVRGERSRVAGYVGVFNDISTLKATEERLEHLARHDPLTDLPNRLLLMSYLSQAVSRSRRSGRSGAVLFLDLDRFKNVNDSLGHAVGDEILQSTARLLRKRLREGDLVARLGGDEFIVLLEDIDGPQAAAAVAIDLIDGFRQPFLLGSGREVYVGLSVGISVFPADGDRTEVLIQNADAALYAAKERGRSTFRFYSEALTVAANERLALESELRRGLALDQFLLHYQPVIRLADGRIEGVEALLRWQSPERGLVMPSSFIGVTEDTGLIVPLGEEVLRRACRQMRSWLDAGLPFGTMAVNVSPRQLLQQDLELRVEAILAETGLEAGYLELEITESAIMEQGAEAEARLAALKSIGVRLAIDDFGTGYSSLSHLRRFPIDTFKIDRSFIGNMPDDRTQREIVLTIISLARQLGLHVVAEGVETERQVAFLREIACDSAQGHFFSPPVPADRIAEIVRN